ncbi:hypothetical protein LIER_30579 [Lithospermum erythrorhizon]|uniref:Uncharacterized protein n=1 Tax=Lithospermum erythrorhizon TaxID=34254 RepID=A0AAV3RS50_LITER
MVWNGWLKPQITHDDLIETYDLAGECLQTNYYGVKRMVETFVPLLKLSDSPRVVNVSSSMGGLKNIPNEWAKRMLNDDINYNQGILLADEDAKGPVRLCLLLDDGPSGLFFVRKDVGSFE